MAVFSVSYFDGISSMSHNATLWLNYNCWQIDYESPEGDKKQVKWQLDNIHPIETVSTVNRFLYGKFPHQIIECNGPELIDVLAKTYPERSFVKKHYHFLISSGFKGLVFLFLVLLALILGGYFFGITFLTNKLINYLPPSYEVELGNSIENSFTKNMEIDSTATTLINRFSKQIDYATDYPIQIKVVENDQMNALALPGGKIIVFKPLLNEIHSPDQLAALLAHEAGHIAKKHTLHLLSRNLGNYVFISMLLGDVSGFTAILIENANQLYTLRYSRQLETEADSYSLAVLKSNNLNQQGLISLFETLKKQEKNSTALDFLSTHPLTDERIRNAQQTIAPNSGQRIYDAKENADSLSSKNYNDALWEAWKGLENIK